MFFIVWGRIFRSLVNFELTCVSVRYKLSFNIVHVFTASCIKKTIFTSLNFLSFFIKKITIHIYMGFCHWVFNSEALIREPIFITLLSELLLCSSETTWQIEPSRETVSGIFLEAKKASETQLWRWRRKAQRGVPSLHYLWLMSGFNLSCPSQTAQVNDLKL